MHLHFATATVVLPEIAIPKSAAKIRSFPSDARPAAASEHQQQLSPAAAAELPTSRLHVVLTA